MSSSCRQCSKPAAACLALAVSASAVCAECAPQARRPNPLTAAAWTLVLLLCLVPPVSASPNLELQSGPGRLGDLSWTHLSFAYSAPGMEGMRDWRLKVGGLQLGAQAPAVADLELVCARFRWTDHGSDCLTASLTLKVAEHAPLVLEGLSWLSRADGRVDGSWQSDAGQAELQWSGGFEAPALALRLVDLNLDLLAADWLEIFNLQVLGGLLSAQLSLGDGALRVSALWTDGLLDGFAGRLAAEAVSIGVELELDLETLGGRSPIHGRLKLEQSAGELLMDSVYLPPPERPLQFDLAWALTVGERLRIAHFNFVDPGSLVAQGEAELVWADAAWQLDSIAVWALEAELASLWPRWLDGPAAAAGFGGLEVEGQVQGQLVWRADTALLGEADLRIHDLSLADPRDRLAVFGLAAHVLGSGGQLESNMVWESARLWGLPLGPIALSMLADEVGWRLLDPLRIPVLDGLVILDSLAWLNFAELPSRWVLDARIAPISLSLLTRELGLLELGGTLAGRFPGVQYQDERLSFTGGIAIDAFSGRIAIEDLQVERPFGTLPAVAAQVELHRLDLLDLTGAFDFGRMEGQMSGWLRDLRLLDWRPVAMDARLFTHEDVPRRRISQRAVNNLSSLGGAGGALLTGTVLRIFDDFPYRRVGLACQLSNNICRMDGVARHESGGFFIVEGRGLPRLDVVGHRRLVDWPQLVRQLETMRQTEGD
ncbi:MAG: hypothetical protein ACXIUM_01730 [Wenzhouxiangella sp.]